MSKVFLLSTNRMTDPYPVNPRGMALAASSLTSAGHQVRQFDFLTQGALWDTLISFKSRRPRGRG